MEKPNNAIRVPCSLKGSFFKFWLLFLKPFHNLTDREMDIAATFLKHRYELSKVIKDDVILDNVTLGEGTKRQIREECNISMQHFQVILSKLKKNKIIVDNRISPKFIPQISETNNNLCLLLLFDFNDK